MYSKSFNNPRFFFFFFFLLSINIPVRLYFWKYFPDWLFLKEGIRCLWWQILSFKSNGLSNGRDIKPEKSDPSCKLDSENFQMLFWKSHEDPTLVTNIANCQRAPMSWVSNQVIFELLRHFMPDLPICNFRKQNKKKTKQKKQKKTSQQQQHLGANSYLWR